MVNEADYCVFALICIAPVFTLSKHVFKEDTWMGKKKAGLPALSFYETEICFAGLTFAS